MEHYNGEGLLNGSAVISIALLWYLLMKSKRIGCFNWWIWRIIERWVRDIDSCHWWNSQFCSRCGFTNTIVPNSFSISHHKDWIDCDANLEWKKWFQRNHPTSPTWGISPQPWRKSLRGKGYSLNYSLHWWIKHDSSIKWPIRWNSAFIPKIFTKASASNFLMKKKLAIRNQISEISPFSRWMTRTTAWGLRTEPGHEDPILIDWKNQAKNGLIRNLNKLRRPVQNMKHISNYRNCWPMLLICNFHQCLRLLVPSCDNLSKMGLGTNKPLIQELSNGLKEGMGSKLKASLLKFSSWQMKIIAVELSFSSVATYRKVASILMASKKQATSTSRFTKRQPKHMTSWEASVIVSIPHIEIPDSWTSLQWRSRFIQSELYDSSWYSEESCFLSNESGHDRMGQQSKTVYIFYILLNQSKTWISWGAQEQLSQFGSYFGAANPILPDDTGWNGKISDAVRSLIRVNDLSSMASLRIPTEDLASFSEEMIEVLNNPLRGKYAHIMHNLFSILLSTEGVRDNDVLRFHLNTTNGAAWSFFNTFGNQDVVLMGEQGDESRRGLLSQLVKDGYFLLHLDRSGHPLVPEIKLRTIQMLLECSPELPAVNLRLGSGALERYLVRFNCTIEGDYTQGLRIWKQFCRAHGSGNNWMEWWVIESWQPLQLISDSVKHPFMFPLWLLPILVWLEKRLNDYKSRSRRLNDISNRAKAGT